MYAPKTDIKPVGLVLYGVFILLEQQNTYVWATKYELCNSGDFVYQLNALLFAFETNITQCKYKQ